MRNRRSHRADSPERLAERSATVGGFVGAVTGAVGGPIGAGIGGLVGGSTSYAVGYTIGSLAAERERPATTDAPIRIPVEEAPSEEAEDSAE